jgi:SSS family solute:Na+ symporter
MEEGMTWAVVIGYFLLLLAIGIYARRRTENSPEGYFLANRGFGPLVLFFTLAATNFSAFTFLGFAGKAYTDGFGQYGIMALGTSVMALMFFVLGRKIWHQGKKFGYVTPGELVGGRYGSRSLQLLTTSVMSVFTIPYLAVQAIGAGYILHMLFPSIETQVGAVATMVIIGGYVLTGGMRASGWTDVVQGIIMIGAMVAAVAYIGHALGGWGEATRTAFDVRPNLFSRPGPNGYFTLKIWLSFFLLWVLADPMFPQIFSRFYTAKSPRSLQTSMILYPLLISFFFLFPVLIGVWAHGTGIEVAQADNVLLIMVETYTPPAVFAFVMVGALAALMSTADSQLLTLSTMLTCDLVGKNVQYSKLATVFLASFAILFVLVGYDPQAGIMGTLVDTTFSGLVVLAPTVIATLYWQRATKWGCMISILGGETVVFLHYLTSFPTFGFLSAMMALVVTLILLVSVSLLGPRTREVIQTT